MQPCLLITLPIFCWIRIYIYAFPDRKKDLIKLSHGEYISLGKIETSLLTNPNIDNICVHGDSLHDYLIALVIPNQKNLEMLAEKVSVHEIGPIFEYFSEWNP